MTTYCIDLRLAALEEKLAKLTVGADGRELTFSGFNLHVENGTGTTACMVLP